LSLKKSLDGPNRLVRAPKTAVLGAVSIDGSCREILNALHAWRSLIAEPPVLVVGNRAEPLFTKIQVPWRASAVAAVRQTS